MEYFSALKPKLIYIFRINDAAHKGCLKIGEATYDGDEIYLAPNSKGLNEAARKRINQYTQTAGIAYDLLHTEMALFKKEGHYAGFNDKEVHEVLLRSGIQRKEFDKVNHANEWFVCDLDTAKKSIMAVKEGRKSLLPGEISEGHEPIVFRPEQREAIDMTLKQFKKNNRMLWNAKMRFGKTLSALQVVKERGDFRRVLILTHRPVVDAGWFEDFHKIFYDTPDFVYGSKSNGEPFETLEKRASKGEIRYVYFASMQDLRGSGQVGGKFDKNNDVFATKWDLIIVDEAHEGTQTQLGEAVMKELTKAETKVLQLSGTPFNLLDGYKEDEIFTWDYVMEQRAKESWDLTHPGDPNPYISLPRLNIYTYDLGRLMDEFADEDIAFNFREFFRTRDDGTFIYSDDVEKFLNLLVSGGKESMYPFATEYFRDIFRHTLWMLPGVKAARALSAMLKKHPVFGAFEIVNVAGEGDEEEANEEALKKVNKAMGPDPGLTRTITLSCGRLTTGVSVKPWTGVFMLSGSFNTAASAYMQTIFRVQTPYTNHGLIKQDCYVFDFAPDRTLKVLAETAKISTKAGKGTESDKKILGDFLNFCPVIAQDGSKMKKFDVDHMLQQLKKVYVERVVQNGFEDASLYNDNLLKLTEGDIIELKDIKGIIGTTKAMARTNDIDVNNQGLTNEEYEEKEKLEKKPKRELTEEEKKRLEELKKKRKAKEDAISILRGISIRMPLMIYGADIEDEEKELTIDNFTSLIDPQSWEEFMPRGITKQKFNAVKKYYDADIFAAAGKRIRQMARAADHLTIEERIERITAIFATFRNPDKETVLTPWRVVNMHMSDTLGGYTFFNEDFTEQIEEPRFVDRGKVTSDVFAPGSYLLEINSKSGLYPLYLAYNMYRTFVREAMFSPETLEDHQRLWDKAVRKSIFVICKTPMAKSITKRTLVGFRNVPINTRYFEDLINQIKNKPENFLHKVVRGHGFWKSNDNDQMKFKAIVGNPPYQEEGESTRKAPIYHLFYDIAFQLCERVTLITPARFLFKAGQTPKAWMDKILSDVHFKVVRYCQKSSEIFDNVDIKGGVVITLHDKTQIFKPIGVFSGYDELTNILTKVVNFKGFKEGEFANLISSRGMYRFHENFYEDLPEASSALESGTGNMITSNAFNLYPAAFFAERPVDSCEYIQLYGRIGNQRDFRWIKKSYLISNEYLETFNVFVPEANGSGAIGEVLSTPIIGTPMIGHTDTFLSIGAFKTKEEAENCLKYVKSKFARTMLGTLKATQHNPSNTWANVPLQDFTSESDIDWSQSVAEIDRQLYAKYGLTEEEVGFIESMIKPM